MNSSCDVAHMTTNLDMDLPSYSVSDDSIAIYPIMMQDSRLVCSTMLLYYSTASWMGERRGGGPEDAVNGACVS